MGRRWQYRENSSRHVVAAADSPGELLLELSGYSANG